MTILVPRPLVCHAALFLPVLNPVQGAVTGGYGAG